MLEIGKDVWIKTCLGDSINWLVELVGGKREWEESKMTHRFCLEYLVGDVID